MKLTVLLDNNTYIDEYCVGEPGVSYYIEDEGVNILLDAGYSDLFLENARRLSVDLDQVSILALSHGHDDHTGGLPAFFQRGDRSRMSLVAHPQALDRKVLNQADIGSPLSRTEIAAGCRLVQSRTPLKLSEHITFLGEIPRTVPFEETYAIGETESGGSLGPDFMADDTALVYRGEQGIYIITGCSHSGICNIVEYAKKVTGEERVRGIIGGFHLFDGHSERTLETVKYLEKLDADALYPCHCTSFAVRAAIHSKTPVHEVGVGLVLNWN